MNIETLIEKYKSTGIEQLLGYEKFNLISITHHSTAIEGSTLTEVETQILLNDGLTPNGKPLEHSLMARDHLEALQFVAEKASNRTPLSVNLIQRIAGLVLKSTGSVYKTIPGGVDSRKGQFRKGNVYVGNSHFPNHAKVPSLVTELVDSSKSASPSRLRRLNNLNCPSIFIFTWYPSTPFTMVMGELRA